MKTINLKPTAKVAVKKNVLKTYDVKDVNTVYLKDGVEFEVELFNPTQDKLLCKLSFNGKEIGGNGIVLLPGQRVFLERYLNNKKKFKFETYEVDNTTEVDYAIMKNGLIEVSFFKELVFTGWCNTVSSVLLSPEVFQYTSPSVVNTMFCSGTTTAPIVGNTTTTANTSNFFTLTASADLSFVNTKEPESKETGRVVEGTKSNQSFSNDYSEFWSTPFDKQKIKILPESQKVYTTEDIKHRSYCSECGKKVKQNDKFCSYCGNKL